MGIRSRNAGILSDTGHVLPGGCQFYPIGDFDPVNFEIRWYKAKLADYSVSRAIHMGGQTDSSQAMGFSHYIMKT
jgi:hypothetical protein